MPRGSILSPTLGLTPQTHLHACTPPRAGPGSRSARYADAKRLPIAFLKGLGLADRKRYGAPVVSIPYHGTDGRELFARQRLRLERGEGRDERFKHPAGVKLMPYGLERLKLARDAGFMVLVEGESDAQTLWHHDFPALGLPGAGAWRNEWSEYLDGIDVVHVIVEPDDGGANLRTKLIASPIRDRLRIVTLGNEKDASALYLAAPEHFVERMKAALRDSIAAGDEIAETRAREEREAREACAALSHRASILDDVATVLASMGAVGEERAAKLVYLATTSRLLHKPVSLAMKGPSSAGKSHTTECVLRLFPQQAFYALSGMSERALAYSEEPLKHRMLVIYEAAGLAGEFASYLVRSLLSEGCIRYETLEKTSEGLRARLIEREGPTGLIVTTTATRLHPENETRLLSVPVNDTNAQTARIMLARAGRRAGDAAHEPDLAPWHALQRWIEATGSRACVPFAEVLVGAIPPVAVRLRRDVDVILSLIEAHELLHQATRERDDAGEIVATLDDYAAVHALVADLIGDAVQATVPESIRETVRAAAKLIAEKIDANAEPTVTVREIAAELVLDRSAASRRAKAAEDAGYLTNQETRRGRPSRYEIGAPLPEALAIMPTQDRLASLLKGGVQLCSDVRGDIDRVGEREAANAEGGVHVCRCGRGDRPRAGERSARLRGFASATTSHTLPPAGRSGVLVDPARPLFSLDRRET